MLSARDKGHEVVVYNVFIHRTAMRHNVDSFFVLIYYKSQIAREVQALVWVIIC